MISTTCLFAQPRSTLTTLYYFCIQQQPQQPQPLSPQKQRKLLEQQKKFERNTSDFFKKIIPSGLA